MFSVRNKNKTTHVIKTKTTHVKKTNKVQNFTLKTKTNRKKTEKNIKQKK